MYDMYRILLLKEPHDRKHRKLTVPKTVAQHTLALLMYFFYQHICWRALSNEMACKGQPGPKTKITSLYQTSAF